MEQGCPGPKWWVFGLDGDADGVRVGASTFSVGHREPTEPGQVFVLDRSSVEVG